MLKKLLLTSIGLVLTCSIALGVSYTDTNLNILGAGMSLYGEKASGADVQIIGINTSDTISIDTGAVGVAYGGDLTSAGQIYSSDVQEVSPNTSATTSMTAETVLFYNGSTVGTANIVLPASPSDGQLALIITQPAITVVALTSDATAINGAKTGLSANTSNAYKYSATTADWHLLY